MKNISRFLIIVGAFFGQIKSSHAHTWRTLSWREQLRIDALLNTSSETQGIQDKQFIYLIGLLLEKKCGLAPADIRYHNGNIDGYPLVVNDDDGNFSRIINYINAWNDPVKMEARLKERCRELGYKDEAFEKPRYLKIEFIGAMLGDNDFHDSQEVIDALNEVGGCL